MKKVKEVDFNNEVKYVVLNDKVYADKKYIKEAVSVAKISPIANIKEIGYNTAINN